MPGWKIVPKQSVPAFRTICPSRWSPRSFWPLCRAWQIPGQNTGSDRRCQKGDEAVGCRANRRAQTCRASRLQNGNYLGLLRQDPELLAVHVKGWHRMIHGFRYASENLELEFRVV